MRVLLIEDDPDVAKLVNTVLTRMQITVDQAANGGQGLALARHGIYDVIILDWMLPDQDGPTICRAIRDAGLPVGILLLTARATVPDRVTGLDSGADDYLVKPFALPELRARVQALGWWAGTRQVVGRELLAGDLLLDLAGQSALVVAVDPLTEYAAAGATSAGRGGHGVQEEAITEPHRTDQA